MNMSKHHILFAGLILAGLLLIVGSGGGGGGGDEPVTGSFSADINGQSFAVRFRCCRERDGGVEIWGVTGDEMRYILIKTVKPANFPTTINLGLGVNLLNWAMYDTDSERTGGEYYTYAPRSGSVTLNRVTAAGCSGSFAFRARIRGTATEVNVTNGVFNVSTDFCSW